MAGPSFTFTEQLMPREDRYGLPKKRFWYTIDQIADLLSLEEPKLRASLIHYDGRTTGTPAPDKLFAVNIMPEGVTPDWRVEEYELYRWMDYKNVRSTYRPNRRR